MTVSIGQIVHQLYRQSWFALKIGSIANISCKIKDFIFPLMVVWRRLDVEVLVGIITAIESIVAKVWKVVI